MSHEIMKGSREYQSPAQKIKRRAGSCGLELKMLEMSTAAPRHSAGNVAILCYSSRTKFLT